MHRSLKTPKALNRRGFRSQKSLFFGFTPFRLDFVVSSAMISATNAAFCETTTNGRALATAQEKKISPRRKWAFWAHFLSWRSGPQAKCDAAFSKAFCGILGCTRSDNLLKRAKTLFCPSWAKERLWRQNKPFFEPLRPWTTGKYVISTYIPVVQNGRKRANKAHASQNRATSTSVEGS